MSCVSTPMVRDRPQARLVATTLGWNPNRFDVALKAAQPERTLLLLRLFDVTTPMITSAIALVIMYRYPISESRAHEIRAELEQRRGKLTG